MARIIVFGGIALNEDAFKAEMWMRWWY